MSEGLKFSTPEQELEYLRSKVLEAEKKLEGAGAKPVRENVVRESITEFKNETGVGTPVAQSPEVENDGILGSLLFHLRKCFVTDNYCQSANRTGQPNHFRQKY